MGKKILVACADYPDLNGNLAMMYVHVRNRYYVAHGMDVVVLNFRATFDYIIDGIRVISLKTYKNQKRLYNILICHTPNVRNHYVFLRKYGKRFAKFIFFFHGHEVVRVSKVYPESYDYKKSESKLYRKMRDVYDKFKLWIWHNYFPKVYSKSEYIFVSKTLFGEFKQFIGWKDKFENHVHIIHNSVSPVFEENNYCYDSDKKYDFITIRGNMDSSVYCIDLVTALARKFPQCKFLVIGKGKWFEINRKPENITWIDQNIDHKSMMKYIDSAKCALMLTRRDSQGVMSCELVTYGIPLISSDIEVCREILGGFQNVRLIRNDDIDQTDLLGVYDQLCSKISSEKIKRYFYENTVKQEEILLK